MQAVHADIEVISCEMTTTKMHEEKSLAERVAAGKARAAKLESQIARNSHWTLKRSSRQWHYLQGSISWLKGEAAAAVNPEVEVDDSSRMELKVRGGERDTNLC